MGNQNRHIIHSINTKVNCTSSVLNEFKQDRISNIVKEAINQLDPYLTKMSSGNQIYFESITLDIDLSSNRIGELKQKIYDEVAKTIDERAINNRVEELVQIDSKPGRLKPIESLIYFLEKGKLPWDKKTIEFDIDVIRNVENSSTAINQILIAFKSNSKSIERFVYQFSNEKILAFLELKMTDNAINIIKTIINSLTENSNTYSKVYDLGFRLAKLFLLSVFEQIVKAENSDAKFTIINSSTLQNWLSKVQEKYPDIDTRIIEKTFRNAPVNGVVTLINQTLGNHQSENILSKTPKGSKHSVTRNSENMIGSHDKDLHNELRQKNNSNSKYRVSNSDTKNDLKKFTGGETGVLVHNAGIVLLHPFLPTFFKKMGLTENGQFHSLECQQRAICLLHFLATGETVFDEDQLYFQKYICNYDNEESIPKELPISAFEMDEAHILLTEALRHWSSLKGTSIPGLRGNFLIRNGVFKHDEFESIIHVEQQTADILLNQLPWNLGFAKWPWHSKLLTIKWS